MNEQRDSRGQLLSPWKVTTREFFRAGLTLSLIYVGSLILLGPGYFALFFAVGMIVIRFSPHWEPAHVVFQRLAGREPVTFEPLRIPGYRWPALAISIVGAAAFFGFGIYLLVTQTFCSTNMICQLLTR